MLCDDELSCSLISLYLLLPAIVPVIASVFFVAIGLLFYKRYKKQTTKKSYITISILCFVGALLIIGIMPARYLLSKINYQNESRIAAKSLDFEVFEPEYMPEKLRYRVIDDPKKLNNNFILSDYGRIQIYEFNTSRTAQVFNKEQTECGPYDPEFGYVLTSCKLLSTTSSGLDIYYNEFPPRKDPLSSRDEAYVRIGDTGITISGDFSDWEEIIEILDSLKSVDATELQYPSNKGYLN